MIKFSAVFRVENPDLESYTQLMQAPRLVRLEALWALQPRAFIG